jgi:GntR family transcriptional regulator
VHVTGSVSRIRPSAAAREVRLFQGSPGIVRQPGTAAHQQIERWFIDMLRSGGLVPGDRLPPESDVARFFGVSRMTLRQALAGLANRGLLERIPGRSGGTFIVEPTIDCDLTGLTGFTEQLRRADITARAKVVQARTVPATRQVAAALAVQRQAPVHEIVRIRLAEKVPLALEHSWFPAQVFPDLLSQRLTGSLYRLLTRHYRQRPHTAVEYLEPACVTLEQAQQLGVEPGVAVMRIERTAHTAAGLAVEYATDLFRPDRIRISVRSNWSADPGAGV